MIKYKQECIRQRGEDMIRIAITDDSGEERGKIMNMLKARFTDCNITEFSSGEDFLKNFCSEMYDIVFLDIFMDGINGMETAKELRLQDNKVKIIFITTSTDFALESYDVFAYGYLVKPILEEKFISLINKLKAEISVNKEKYYIIKNSQSIRKISYNDIEYIESLNTKLYINLTDGERIIIYDKLSNAEAELDGRFLRCHQSYLVNMDYIADMPEDFVMHSGKTVPVRVRSRRQMKNTYHDYFIKSAMKNLEVSKNV